MLKPRLLLARRLRAPMQVRIVESFCAARTWTVGLALAALLASGLAQATVAPLAPVVPFTVGGRVESTAQLKGHPTLLWLLSTWCGSCAAGLQALRNEAAQLEMARLHVIVLRNYKDGGYPGPHIRSFVKRVAPALLSEPNWTFGQASLALEQAYNGRHYPDIYYLIDATGHIQAVDSAPGATMNRILRFAGRAAQ